MLDCLRGGSCCDSSLSGILAFMMTSVGCSKSECFLCAESSLTTESATDRSLRMLLSYSSSEGLFFRRRIEVLSCFFSALEAVGDDVFDLGEIYFLIFFGVAVSYNAVWAKRRVFTSTRGCCNNFRSQS